MSELMNIKSIKDHNKKNIMEKFGYNLNQAWYFEKTVEKIILVVLCTLGLMRIVQWVI